MEPPSDRGSSPVLPRVWTRGVRTSPLVPHVSPRRVLQLATTPRSRGQRHSTPSSLSLACVVVSASPPLLRRARARVSPCLRSSNSVQCSASLSTPPSSSWLRLPSLGEPALPSPPRACLAGVPPWPPASWPGLCSPPFFLILVPKAPLGHADARPHPLPLCLRPETPAVGRAPPPCRHSRGRGA
jgi:hypothetical protein